MGTTSPRSPRSPFARWLASGLILGASLVAACTEGPRVDPTALGPQPGVLTIVPTLAYRASVPAGSAQADALNAAFDRVDRFRLVIRRQSNNELVRDTVIAVTPGRNLYDLSAPVPSLLPNEQFIVVITALQGDVVLFQSAPVTVSAVPENAAAGPGSSPRIELDYTGPGAGAASVTLAPTGVLMAPGGARPVTATVRTSAGAVVAGVPLSWSSASAGVATVSAAGQVTGVGEGATQITATTPTGLSASTWAYVVTGDVAFVQGGHVRLRAVAGGTVSDLTPGASSASAPSFGPGGTALAYADGGGVFVGSARVSDGGWPSISPDGAKLAVERSGRVFFTNLNGSNPTAGPAGTTPVWMPNGSHLAVGGGSVERVKADGTERSTLASGAATLPALGSGGQLAYVSGGALQVQGRGSVLTGVSGRPAWSPGARWLVVPAGSDLMLVDAVGSAPAIALGVGAASDPTWRGAAPSGSATAPSVGSLDPASPVPGAEITLVGRGFDWIIPANNRVFFPGAAGPVQGEVRTVTETRLTALMPAGTPAGSIRLVTTVGETTIGFAPSNGAIRVRTRMAGDVAAPGMRIMVRRGAEIVGEADTNADGRVSFNLVPGDYIVSLLPPYGYAIYSANPVPVRLGFDVADVTFDVGVLPVRVTLDPPSPLRLEVGAAPTNIRAHAFDARGNEISTFRTLRWLGSARVQVGGGLDARIAGTSASAAENDATFTLALDGETFEFAATVTTFVAGTLTQVPDGGGTPTPLPNQSVQLREASGRATAATSNAQGAYRFGGLMGGTYTLIPNVPSGFAASPASRSVELGPGANGQDFVFSRSYIEGTVTEGGSPAAGVTLRLYASGSETVLASVTTGADGRYKFAALASGTYVVRAEVAAGKVVNPASRTATLDATHTSVSGQDFTVSATSISGTVREGGTGVAGVTVLLFNAGSATTLATTTTNGSGAYTFTAMGAGSFDVKANAPSGKVISPASRSATISGAAPTATGQDFTVNATSISGTVTQSGSGLSGVTIQLFNAGSATPLSSTTTSSGGTYTLTGMGPGTFDVKATAPSGKVVSPASRSATISAGTPTATGQDFTVSATFIEGTVTESGSPVSGVTVRLFPSGSASAIATTTTNGSGVYRFDAVGAGTFDVKATAPSGKTVSPTNISVTISASQPSASGQNFTLSGAVSYPPGRPNLLVPVPANLIVTHNGLDWVYASPCSINGCTAGIAVGKDGFGFATTAQWALRPPYTMFSVGNLCASPYFDFTWNHCDYGDAAAGYVGSGPYTGSYGGGSPAPNNPYADTWLVRVHVASASLREAPAIGVAPAVSAPEGDPRTRVVPSGESAGPGGAPGVAEPAAGPASRRRTRPRD